jgi:hypothetical protein
MLLAAGPVLPDEFSVEPGRQAAQLDLSGPFRTRSPWRLVVSEGPPTKDVFGEPAPGVLTICLLKSPAVACDDEASVNPRVGPAEGGLNGLQAHYLIAAKIVYPQGPTEPALLQLRTGGLFGANGDQALTTQLIAYDASRDAFRRVFQKTVGANNNQEVRLVSAGPLRGSVIVAEPQQKRPFGYWITVFSRSGSGAYRQVLRYASATRYNDGNPLAVIDSEWPGIQRRLGIWKAGLPIPTPDRNGGDRPCPTPNLRHGALWCAGARTTLRTPTG